MEETSDEKISVFEINCRLVMSSFDFPKPEEVISKLEGLLPCEYVVEALNRHKSGIFHVHLDDDIYLKDLPTLEFEKRTRFSEMVVKVRVPGTKIPTHGGKRSGTLITILKCALTREHKAIQNVQFDDFFKSYGSIEKQTCYQFYQNTNSLNGNRYLVLNIDNPKNIPAIVKIGENKFFTRFKGQSWKCSRCWVEHVGGCPEIKAFNEAKQKRKEMEITTKIVSDSTLRRSETVGLKADILCVPGGGIGDIANAIVDQKDQHEKLIIMAGINDIQNSKIGPISEFAYVVDKSLEKLDRITKENQKVSIDILAPITPFNGLPSVEMEDRNKILIDRIQHYCNTNEKMKQKHLDSGSITFEDHLHPDEEGTIQIMKQISKMAPSSLIWNEEYLAHSKYYGGVETAQRWGCTTCWVEGVFMFGRCDTCLEEMKNYSPSYLSSYENNVNITTPQKRPRSPDSQQNERQVKEQRDNV